MKEGELELLQRRARAAGVQTEFIDAAGLPMFQEVPYRKIDY